MDNKGDEYVFLGDRLGMLFSVQEGRVRVIGLDSAQYQQQQTPSQSQPQSQSESKREEENQEEDEHLNQQYKGVISLKPGGVTVPAVPPSEEQGVRDARNPPGPDTVKEVDNATLLPNEIISALANLEDVPNEIEVVSEQQLSEEVPGGNINHLPCAPAADNSATLENSNVPENVSGLFE